MRQSRIILFAFGLLAVGLVSMVAAWQAGLLWRFPEIQTADRAGVLQWLVSRDLHEETQDLRQQLLSRIEVVFDGEIQLDGVSQLDERQRSRLNQNISLLKEIWFHEKVDRFYQCAKDARGVYLDSQIATLLRWAAIDAAISGVPDAAGSPARIEEYLTAFLDAIDGWIARTRPSGQQRIRDVVNAGLIRWLSTQDLSRESRDLRRQIVAGIEHRFGGPIRIGDSANGFSESQAARFWRNVVLLAEIWFHDNAARLARLPSNQQAEFMNRRIDFVEEIFFAPPMASHSNGLDLTTKINSWASAATGDTTPTRNQLQRFAQHLQVGLMMRRVKRFFSSERK